mmetsp:Transcript_6420/g.14000  ORF Transcript_6420/g.14000 Transcript_6420/m.14000 type:complete len:278 (+) Transcript_6420:219-1052(+)
MRRCALVRSESYASRNRRFFGTLNAAFPTAQRSSLQTGLASKCQKQCSTGWIRRTFGRSLRGGWLCLKLDRGEVHKVERIGAARADSGVLLRGGHVLVVVPAALALGTAGLGDAKRSGGLLGPAAIHGALLDFVSRAYELDLRCKEEEAQLVDAVGARCALTAPLGERRRQRLVLDVDDELRLERRANELVSARALDTLVRLISQRTHRRPLGRIRQRCIEIGPARLEYRLGLRLVRKVLPNVLGQVGEQRRERHSERLDRCRDDVLARTAARFLWG